MHNYESAGMRIYDTFHKINGYIMDIWRDYDFQSFQVNVLLDNGKIYNILPSEYVLTPNE